MNTLLLDKSKLQIRLSDLPCLIHGVDKSGASYFTVNLLADMYRHSVKVLFFSAYHMARDTFLELTNMTAPLIIKNSQLPHDADKKQIIFIESGDHESFVYTVQSLPDINERVILIKNIEVFEEKVYEQVEDKPFIIISGDIEKCSYKQRIFAKKYQTNILFSPLDMGIKLPKLEQYHGYLSGKDKHGIVRLFPEATFIDGYSEPEVFAKIGGKAVILNPDGKILILKRSNKIDRAGGWDFPGGAIEFGENPTDAINREVKEETGLRVTDVRPIHIQTFPITKVNQDFIVMIGFIAKTITEDVQLSWEHTEYRWVTKEEALSLDLPEVHRSFIEKIQ